MNVARKYKQLLVEHEIDDDMNRSWCSWSSHQEAEEGFGGIGV